MSMEKLKSVDRAKMRTDALLEQEKSQAESRIADLQGIFFFKFNVSCTRENAQSAIPTLLVSCQPPVYFSNVGNPDKCLS